MLHVIRAVGLIGCILVLWTTFPAAQAGPAEDCNQDRDPDRTIQGCTQIIRRHTPNYHRYVAFYNRGVGYRLKGDLDAAIADFSEAIKLNPNYANAYHNRGVLYLGKGDYDRAIADVGKVIDLDPRSADAYNNRGRSYLGKGDYDRAIADFGKAINLDPSLAYVYRNRGWSYLAKGDYDRAIADYTEAIRLNPKDTEAFRNRANAYAEKKDYARAIADFTKVIEINRRDAIGYNGRAWTYYLKGDYERAVADATAAVSINAKVPDTYHTRGEAYRGLRQYDRAIGDFSQALALDATHFVSVAGRGMAYEAKGDRERAMEDYSRAMSLPVASQPVTSKWEKDLRAEVEARLAALQRASEVASATTAPSKPAAPSTAAAVPLGRRVALVIGNAAYRAVPKLDNPLHDARRVAAALRAAGFTDVVDRYDLSIQEMRDVLAQFEDKVAGADWAVVYYAGHGIEVDGRNFLIPVDARLKRATDVEDEALGLDRVLARVAAAKRLQLVILDACRENPFRQTMTGATRSIGARGLARVEPSHPNLLVAYAARDGQVALDGKSGEGSPYARALVKHLAEPGLELSVFFRRVRAEVLAATQDKQRPFEYGSLISEDLYFRPPKR